MDSKAGAKSGLGGKSSGSVKPSLKLIVSNRSALLRKYKTTGLAAIRKAVTALVTADKARGIATKLLFLDDAAAMKAAGGVAVKTAGNPRENKAAIDAACKALQPAYLMILGAPDVVPHQDLDNTASSPPDDDDAHAWGDLPYACDAPYSRDVARFVGPTRVVGRLPDLAGASEPSYLIKLLQFSARFKSLSAADFKSYFGLSATQWQGSTRLSLQNLFGQAEALQLCPPKGPTHVVALLRSRAHFINCHGGTASPMFLGQSGSSYPTALTTKSVAAKLSPGTVAAVECCYGAEMYDAATLGLDMPICQSYLAQGAAGYLGSTTIAYGPADDNGAADLICQFFLQQVFKGASLGRAALLARQQFVQQAAQMDPVDLKTLAQFILLGDPSLQPVATASAQPVAKGVAAQQVAQFARAERRAKLQAVGQFLAEATPTASQRDPAAKPAPAVRAALANIAQQAGLPGAQAFTAFAIEGGAAAPASPGRGRAAKAAAQAAKDAQPARYHLAVGTPADNAPAPTKTAPATVNRGIAVVAKEADGRIVGYRIYHQR